MNADNMTRNVPTKHVWRPEYRGSEMRRGGDGTEQENERVVSTRKKLNLYCTLSSLGGLDWDLARIFPTPPLPEEKNSPSSWG